jgi:hypothetical protein
MAAASVCAKPAVRTPSTPSFHLKVVRVYPHDARAFTQGLLFLDGKLYESTGLYARSSIRRVDLTSGQVEQEFKLPAELFGEGLARVGDRLVQLTWKNHKRWSGISHAKEGIRILLRWGRLGTLFRRPPPGHERRQRQAHLANPNSFAKEGEVRVRLAGRPLCQPQRARMRGRRDLRQRLARQPHRAHRRRLRRGHGWIDASGLLDPLRPRARTCSTASPRWRALATCSSRASCGRIVYEVEVVPDRKAEVDEAIEQRFAWLDGSRSGCLLVEAGGGDPGVMPSRGTI